MELFNLSGRLYPAEGERIYSPIDRGYFSLNQPAIDYGVIHANIAKFLKVPSLADIISVESFQERCEKIKATVTADENTRNLFKGIQIPFLALPPAGDADIGHQLDSVLLEGVDRSYTAKFPEFTFTNYMHGELAGKLSVVPGVRYEKLLDAWKQGPVVGWYFPTCMAGFAIPDQRALMKRLPEQLILSGPIEASFAFVGMPGILMKKDNYPNLLALTAVKPTRNHFFCFFEAYGWNLTFNQRSMIGTVSEYYAGGLTVIG